MKNETEFDLKAEGRPISVLNLYACLGGNRYKWENCNVTAVELDPELARMYQERFPNDTVIVADAHQYLLDHYKEFDFIWSSPPCPTHSRARFWRASGEDSEVKAVYPEMTLYQEIIFLENYFKGKFCVENVIPFYEPLIPGKKRGRHLYWTNFPLPNLLSKRDKTIMREKDEVRQWCEYHEYDFYQYKGEQRTDKIARNLVDYEAGLTIFQCAVGAFKSNSIHQHSLWNT
jgi:DNA (cytosine-5)-methyltransferase 1